MSEPRVWLRRAATRDFRNLEKVDLDLPEPGLALIGGLTVASALTGVRALFAFLVLPGVVAFAVPLLVFAPRAPATGFGDSQIQPVDLGR